MTGRQNALAVFRRQGTPDRVPWMEQSICSDVASAIMGKPMDTGGMALWKAEADAWLDGGDAGHEEWLEKCFHDLVDFCRQMGIVVTGPPWQQGRKPTGRIDDNTYFFDEADGTKTVWCYDPASGAMGWKKTHNVEPTIEDVEAAVEARERSVEGYRPGPDEFASRVRLREIAGEDIEVLGSSFLSVPMQSHFLEAIVLRPELIERWLDAGVEQNVKQFAVQADLGFHVLNGGGDLADNHGTIYSPRFFREVVAPRYKRKVAAAHEHGFCYIFRSDGNLWSIADCLVEHIGCDAFGEIDVDAGMDMQRLHERFPDLILWGGLSCGKLLRLGKPEQVKAEARRLLDTIGRGNRLVIGSSNSIMHGTPPENILAIREVLME